MLHQTAIEPHHDEIPYEAPAVEKVLTALDLAREVQYAGTPSQVEADA